MFSVGYTFSALVINSQVMTASIRQAEIASTYEWYAQGYLDINSHWLNSNIVPPEELGRILKKIDQVLDQQGMESAITVIDGYKTG